MVASSSGHKDIKRGVPLGLKLYGIVGFVFLCFIALSVYGLFQLKDALESQRSAELKHLTELAVKAVREEYEASQSGAISASKRKFGSVDGCVATGANGWSGTIDQRTGVDLPDELTSWKALSP